MSVTLWFSRLTPVTVSARSPVPSSLVSGGKQGMDYIGGLKWTAKSNAFLQGDIVRVHASGTWVPVEPPMQNEDLTYFALSLTPVGGSPLQIVSVPLSPVLGAVSADWHFLAEFTVTQLNSRLVRPQRSPVKGSGNCYAYVQSCPSQFVQMSASSGSFVLDTSQDNVLDLVANSGYTTTLRQCEVEWLSGASGTDQN